ncbi:hypothetical protein FS837_002080 [Tulasnella sp. UAMH 9824]|nr:hypothetical protein FS837_002080 [Tulasnella sp. UAMH 9824]
MTLALKQLLGRAFHGITDTNSRSSANPAQSLPLEKLLLFMRFPASWRAIDVHVKLFVALRPPGRQQSSLSLPEEALRSLSRHVLTFRWHHWSNMADRDCVVDAVRRDSRSIERDLEAYLAYASDYEHLPLPDYRSLAVTMHYRARWRSLWPGDKEYLNQSRLRYKSNRSNQDEANIVEELAEAGLMHGGASLAEDKNSALGAPALLIGTSSSVNPLAENDEDQKRALEKAKQFDLDAHQAPSLTQGEGHTPRQRVDGAIKLFEEGTLFKKFGAQEAHSLREQPDRGDKWLEAPGYEIEAHYEAPRAKLPATSSDVRKKCKAGRMKHGSQRAAEGELGSAVHKTSNSAPRQGGEDLEHVELKALPKESEEQNESGVDVQDDMEAGEMESKASSK